MDFPSKIYQLPSKLGNIRYQDEAGRREFAHFLGIWLHQVPHLLDIDPQVLLEGVGLLYPTGDTPPSYASTWAWEQCWKWDSRRPQLGVGLLWWLEQWRDQPCDAVIAGLTVWCHIGRFQAHKTLGRYSFIDDVWDRFQKYQTLIPALAKLIQLCDGPPLWTREQVYVWKARHHLPILEIREVLGTNPCNEIPLEPAVKWGEP